MSLGNGCASEAIQFRWRTFLEWGKAWQRCLLQSPALLNTVAGIPAMEVLGMVPVTLLFCVVAVVAGFVQWNWRFGAGNMAFEPEQVSGRGQWYRVLTAPVSHTNFGHLLLSLASWAGTAGLVELSIGSWSLFVLTVLLSVRYAASGCVRSGYHWHRRWRDTGFHLPRVGCSCVRSVCRERRLRSNSR